MSPRCRLLASTGVLVLAPLVLGGTRQQAAPAQEEVRVEIVAAECEEGLSAIVESQILKVTSAKITRKDPSHKIILACHWQQSPAHSTSFYSSWGNADLTIRVERVSDESTLYSESYTEGAKSRGLAMKKAAERAVADLLESKVLPKK